METANNITINTDDKNLAEVIKKIIADAGLTIADLFDDDEVRDHIHESGLPADEIYDEDDILDCGCVTDKIQELEDQIAELEEKNDELDTKNAKLKKKNAELAKERDDYGECLARIQSAILEDANLRKAFESRWNRRFVDEEEDEGEEEEGSDAETEIDEDQDNFTNRVCGYYPECGKGFHLDDPHYYDEEVGECYCSEECFKKEQNRFAEQDRCDDKEKTEE
jgi:hypothetical protein